MSSKERCSQCIIQVFTPVRQINTGGVGLCHAANFLTAHHSLSVLAPFIQIRQQNGCGYYDPQVFVNVIMQLQSNEPCVAIQ